MPSLDGPRLHDNARAGRETVLLFDTNVIGQMYDFAMAGGRHEQLAEFGLDQLIRVLNLSGDGRLALTAGLASRELTPAMASRFHRVYEWFLGRFAPQYVDHPFSLPPDLWVPREDNGFWDKPYEDQIAFALPYALLLLMQVVMIDDSERNATDRFERFVRLVLAEIDVLSAKEMEIARWCFSPAIDRDPAYGRRRKAMIWNFTRMGGKRPRSALDLRRIALNGAYDLFLITAAVHADAHGLDGVAQDTWITTYDGKLARYCELFSYAPAGSLSGAIVARTEVPTDRDPGYWRSTADFLRQLELDRVRRALRKTYQPDEMIERVRRIEAIVASIAKSKVSP